jgi:N-acetylmuramoyl-L-alanine amidase
MNDNFCVFLDAGHGGVNPLGLYTTAPGKQFQHQQGQFHNGSWFYEGVWNRNLVARVIKKLDILGIQYLPVYHEYVDFPLQYRVDQANWYYRNYRRGIFLSTHANASGVGARGYEIYTSPGETSSDRIADAHWGHVKDLLGDGITMRTDRTDGDYDKEARFYVLTRTVMPAVLIEHLFFDNYQDARLLMDPETVDRFAEAQVRTIIDFINNL